MPLSCLNNNKVIFFCGGVYFYVLVISNMWPDVSWVICDVYIK